MCKAETEWNNYFFLFFSPHVLIYYHDIISIISITFPYLVLHEFLIYRINTNGIYSCKNRSYRSELTRLPNFSSRII